jgi:hypothetical protein
LELASQRNWILLPRWSLGGSKFTFLPETLYEIVVLKTKYIIQYRTMMYKRGETNEINSSYMPTYCLESFNFGGGNRNQSLAQCFP